MSGLNKFKKFKNYLDVKGELDGNNPGTKGI